MQSPIASRWRPSRREALLALGATVAGGLVHYRARPALGQSIGVPIVRRATGNSPGDIAAAVEQFRADLGGANNGAGPPASSGRREINWDGVPDSVASPNPFPADFFNRNSPRGAVFSTPGSGFQVSADSSNPTNTPQRFGNIDSSYTDTFTVFSPQRLFTAIGSNQLDVLFFVPGTSRPATVSGFGAVFTDVDTESTFIEYFNAGGNSIGRFAAPHSPAARLSFLGVSFISRGSGNEARVARVRITSGVRALGAGVRDGLLQDLVVMDDFIYGEPRAI